MPSNIAQNPAVRQAAMNYMKKQQGPGSSGGGAGAGAAKPGAGAAKPIINSKQANQQKIQNDAAGAPAKTAPAKTAPAPAPAKTAPVVPYSSPPPEHRTITKTNTSKIVIAVIGVLFIVGIVLLLYFVDCNDIASYRSTGESTGDCGGCSGDSSNNCTNGIYGS